MIRAFAQGVDNLGWIPVKSILPDSGMDLKQALSLPEEVRCPQVIEHLITQLISFPPFRTVSLHVK